MFAYDPPTPASESIGGLLRDWSSHRGGGQEAIEEGQKVYILVLLVYTYDTSVDPKYDV